MGGLAIACATKCKAQKREMDKEGKIIERKEAGREQLRERVAQWT